jgi:UDP-N-acetylmuramoyl-L-alanyl-D-glutamate--2,6-diaminopimelate ligase
LRCSDLPVPLLKRVSADLKTTGQLPWPDWKIMRVGELFSDEATIDPRARAAEVSGLAVDSRTVRPGEVFFALAGSRTDGTRFIDQAIASGAIAIVSEHAPEGAPPVPFISTPNPRRALARAAARFYPRQPATIAAVTGTSGKTSVAAFTRQIWQRLGHQSASIGTIGLVSPKRTLYGSLTTPDPIALHRQLDELAGEGVTHLAFEASSHGLDQYRLDGVRIAAGAFTNLSRDHMDYHPDLAHYLAAKLRLFGDLVLADGVAVISMDHDSSSAVMDAARTRGLRIFPIGRKADGVAEGIRLAQVEIDGLAQRLLLEYRGRRHPVLLPLVGEFQVENALVAAGIAVGTGSEPDDVFAALELLEGAKGRLERVAERNGAPIFIDYAHKPDALAKALLALRPYAKRKLVVVLGAGGDRDVGKRPLMGAIAAENSDAVIVTDDNPRSEDPGAIRAAILSAAPGATEIGDRAEAIRTAIAALEPGDALLIAGKGHETGQIVGERVLPFSDHDAVAAAIAQRTA